MDADLTSIDDSGSAEMLLSILRQGVKCGVGIGPGAYDIHSSRTLSTEELVDRTKKMLQVFEEDILWLIRDSGRKTLKHAEAKLALSNMVSAANLIHTQFATAE